MATAQSPHLATPFPQRLLLYARLLRWHRPIGFALLVWPTLWAVWLAASGRPDTRTVFVFVLGALLMRSAGCAINDWADRHFDRHVTRTRERPLAAGWLYPGEALALAGLLTMLAAAVLALLPFNPLVWALALVAVGVAASYPFFKRFFAVPQAYLGVAFGLGIPMAYVSIRGDMPWSAWLLIVANVFWAVAYDTEYAMVDREDDLKIGLRTSAITLGRWDVLGIMISYGAALLLWGGVGVLEALGPAYYVGWGVAALIALYHGYLIRGRDPERCFAAFRHNGWLGAALFAGLWVDAWLR